MRKQILLVYCINIYSFAKKMREIKFNLQKKKDL